MAPMYASGYNTSSTSSPFITSSILSSSTTNLSHPRQPFSTISPYTLFYIIHIFSLLISSFIIFSAAAPRPTNDGYNCKSLRPSFPDNSFSSQPNNAKVYLVVNKLSPSSLTEAGLTKFASAFGIRILGDDGVGDDKIIYVTTLLAELLDIHEDGKPSNKNLVKSLRSTHSMLVLVSTTQRQRMLSIRQYRPKELKCFSRAFHVAHAAAIRTDQSKEKICPEDAGRKDRARGLVGDFIVSKGYPSTYPANAEIGIRMKDFFIKAKSRNWINTAASNCQSTVCLEIAFQSWALSSALSSDKCWCLSSKEWKFCTPESMKQYFPELWGTLAGELMLNGVMQPDGHYYSSAII